MEKMQLSNIINQLRPQLCR